MIGTHIRPAMFARHAPRGHSGLFLALRRIESGSAPRSLWARVLAWFAL